MDELSFVAARATGPARRETLMGRSFDVFPAVLVREQVLHNNLGLTFLPADEIKASLDAWNGMPVVLDHPTKRGQHVSARDPEVLNARGAGFVFRARFEDAELKADIFVDPERASEIEGVGEVVNGVREGTPGEISTGFGTALEENEGVFNGRRYDIILRDIRPDHLALLAEDQGACSVEDGCGLGVNHEGACEVEDEGAEEDTDPAASNEDADPDPEEAVGLLERAMVALRGVIGGNQEDEFSLDDLREAVSGAIEQEAGGSDRFTWIVELFDDRVVYGVEVRGGERSLFRAPFTVDEDEREVELGEREEVEKVTTFEPVENRWQAQTRYEAREATTEEETDMDRCEMIDALAGNEDVPYRRETLEAMSDEELAHAANSAGLEAEGAEDAEDGTSPEVEGADDDPQPTPEDAENVTALLREIRDDNRELKEKVSELEDATRPAVQERERERESLIDALAGNERVPFEKDELEAKGVEELRKISSLARGENYAGRGGPKDSTANSGEPRFMPVKPYHADSEEG